MLEKLREFGVWFLENQLGLLDDHYNLLCLGAFTLNVFYYLYFHQQLKTRIQVEECCYHLMTLKVPIAASFSRKRLKVVPILGTFIMLRDKGKKLEGPSSPHLVGLSPQNLSLLALLFLCLVAFIATLDRGLQGLPSFSVPYLTFSFLCGSLLVWKIFFITEGLRWNRTFLLRISKYNREHLGVPCSVKFSWDSFKIEPRAGCLSFASAPSTKKGDNVMTNAEGTSCPPG